MQPDPKPSEKPDLLAEPMHDADSQDDPKKDIDEEGEPFDGNFAYVRRRGPALPGYGINRTLRLAAGSSRG